jgi:HPt (histidine-containing phosphotransfer) domain-containing protein
MSKTRSEPENSTEQIAPPCEPQAAADAGGKASVTVPAQHFEPHAALRNHSVDEDVPAFDFAEAMRQLGGRETLFREMVAYLGTQSREVFAQIRRAGDAGNAESLWRAAHALKGTLVYLAAAPAMSAVQHVEQLARAGDVAAAASACQDLEREVARLQRALTRVPATACLAQGTKERLDS